MELAATKSSLLAAEKAIAATKAEATAAINLLDAESKAKVRKTLAEAENAEKIAKNNAESESEKRWQCSSCLAPRCGDEAETKSDT